MRLAVLLLMAGCGRVSGDHPTVVCYCEDGEWKGPCFIREATPRPEPGCKGGQ